MAPNRAKAGEQPVVEFRSRQEMTDWLKQNHSASPGVWIRFARQASGIECVRRDHALEEALCFGWIDGQTKSETPKTWLQKFTPRRPRSTWSKINRQKALDLIAGGRMHAAGLAEIERAKADGRWDAAYDSPAKATPPPDLLEALKRKPRARTRFEKLDSRNRYAILFRIQTARKPETRAARIAQFVEMLSEGRTLYPPLAG